ELAGLGALDDAVVVGRRERDDLADADGGERRRIGPLVLRRVVDGTGTDDRALSAHEARDREDRSDHAGVRQGDGRAFEVVRRDLPAAYLADGLFVRGVVAGEVERVGGADVRDEKRTCAVLAFEVDGETEIDVLVPD